MDKPDNVMKDNTYVMKDNTYVMKDNTYVMTDEERAMLMRKRTLPPIKEEEEQPELDNIFTQLCCMSKRTKQ